MGAHQPITTVEEIDALDREELHAGYMGAKKGDPEPGPNHTRSYHHGWRTAMMDLGEIEITDEHQRLAHLLAIRDRGGCLRHERGQSCRWCGPRPTGRAA
jgi:hypothetical protein